MNSSPIYCKMPFAGIPAANTGSQDLDLGSDEFRVEDSGSGALKNAQVAVNRRQGLLALVRPASQDDGARAVRIIAASD